MDKYIEHAARLASVKRVVEVDSDQRANELIGTGWVLLACGFSKSDEHEYPLYILGTDKEPEPRGESKFAKFIKDHES